jgi:hypothetical protein
MFLEGFVAPTRRHGLLVRSSFPNTPTAALSEPPLRARSRVPRASPLRVPPMERIGIEPMTSCLQSRRSPN